MHFGVHVKYPLFFFDFIEAWTFYTYVRNILRYRISWNPVQWESSCSMRIDGQTWRSSRFSQFCERVKKFNLYLAENNVLLLARQFG